MHDVGRILDMSHDALGVIRSGAIVLVNAAGQGFGMRQGSELSTLVPVDELPGLLHALVHGGEIQVRTAGLNVKWLTWRFRTEGDVQVFSAHDSTALRESEQLMGDYISDIGRRSVEIEQFAYAASHDIQEPLRTITNYVHYLMADHSASLNEEALEYLQFVGDAAKHCRELVRALMSYSSLGRDPHFVQVSSITETRRIIAALDTAISESGATVLCGPLPDMWGDAALFRTILTNLLSNALKFSTDPVVKIGGIETEDNWVFWVSDNGVGIEPRYAAQIFNVFRRLDKTKPGVGIGLASAKKAVSIHLGQLWVDSTPGQGSTFYFTVERPYDCETAFGGRPRSGRKSPAESTAQLQDAIQAFRSTRWRDCAEVLAWKGALSRGDTSRPDLARPEPTKGHGVRGTGGDQGT